MLPGVLASNDIRRTRGERDDVLSETTGRHAAAVREMVHELAGEIDPSGVEIVRLVRMTANLYDARVDEALRETGLSGPRWGLLLRLLAEEKRGVTDGMSPTHLSQCQNVSKNTISALIGGLEDQGLVARELNQEDKRVFRIRLTESGRQTVCETAPDHIAFLNEIAKGLTTKEREQLIGLLEKLHRSLQSVG